MARLYAKCTVPVSHVQGKIGWTLTYQDPLETHYERFSNTTQSNISAAELTVYSTSSSIPGYSRHKNISTATSFQYINSSFGTTNSSQDSLVLFNEFNTIDTRIDRLYNLTTNTNTSIADNDSNVYKSFKSITYNVNNTRVKNRQFPVVANNSKKVAIGNDSDIYGICYFEREGLFPAGIYVLDVQRFSPDFSIPLKTNRNVWIIKAPQKELTCGTYLDIYNSINLQ